jgi:hypothetical protein
VNRWLVYLQAMQMEPHVFRKDLVSLRKIHVLGEKTGLRDVRVCRHGVGGGEEQGEGNVGCDEEENVQFGIQMGAQAHTSPT